MSAAHNNIRPKLIGGLVGAGIATSFCVISAMAQLMPPRSAPSQPLKTIPLTALYSYLAYRNARESGRTYRLINNQPEATPRQGYNRLASLHWNFALTGAAYTLRAALPETQVAHTLVDTALTGGFVAAAYHCRNKAQPA